MLVLLKFSGIPNRKPVTWEVGVAGSIAEIDLNGTWMVECIPVFAHLAHGLLVTPGKSLNKSLSFLICQMWALMLILRIMQESNDIADGKDLHRCLSPPRWSITFVPFLNSLSLLAGICLGLSIWTECLPSPPALSCCPGLSAGDRFGQAWLSQPPAQPDPVCELCGAFSNLSRGPSGGCWLPGTCDPNFACFSLT